MGSNIMSFQHQMQSWDVMSFQHRIRSRNMIKPSLRKMINTIYIHKTNTTVSMETNTTSKEYNSNNTHNVTTSLKHQRTSN